MSLSGGSFEDCHNLESEFNKCMSCIHVPENLVDSIVDDRSIGGGIEPVFESCDGRLLGGEGD